MNGWLIYWITRLDGIRIVAWVVLGLTCACAILPLLNAIDAGTTMSLYPDDSRLHIRAAKELSCAGKLLFKLGFVAAFVLFIAALTPTTNEAAAIYLIPKIANNEQVQKVPEQALRLLNTKLEQWIDDQIGTDTESEDDGE